MFVVLLFFGLCLSLMVYLLHKIKASKGDCSAPTGKQLVEDSCRLSVNPATGLQMVGSCDVAGNSYGSGMTGD